MADSKRTPRRRHAAELKKQVLSRCAEPGASVAKVALAHGLNANLVHKWRRGASGGGAVRRIGELDAFVPLALAPSSMPAASDIRIELRRGLLAVNVTWPLAAAAQCAVWVREVLK